MTPMPVGSHRWCKSGVHALGLLVELDVAVRCQDTLCLRLDHPRGRRYSAGELCSVS